MSWPGARRLAAWKELRRNSIPVTIIDLEKIARGEYAENTFRKQFTPSECAEIADALEPIERALAKERQVAAHASPGKFPEQADIADEVEPIERALAKERSRESGRAGGKGSGNFSDPSKGNARDRTAHAVGSSAPSIAKARAVRDAAAAEPERFGKLQADMDRTGRV